MSCESIGFKITNSFLVTGGGAKNSSVLKVCVYYIFLFSEKLTLYKEIFRPNLKVLADVFGVSVFISDSYKSAAVGAAYRALHGKKCAQAGNLSKRQVIGTYSSHILHSHFKGNFIPFSEVVGSPNYGEHKIEHSPSNHQTYKGLLERYRILLQQISTKT